MKGMHSPSSLKISYNLLFVLEESSSVFQQHSIHIYYILPSPPPWAPIYFNIFKPFSASKEGGGVAKNVKFTWLDLLWES